MRAVSQTAADLVAEIEDLDKAMEVLRAYLRTLPPHLRAAAAGVGEAIEMGRIARNMRPGSQERGSGA